ncbi:hypothetical protein POF50_011030 [Streptomyces sp. SL13]|uniref:Gene product 88 domain-containing protein n=1 Tax=Streptantibioticus silvisoli TaxID=2705255 RepID=A0AA90H8H0_9ACTN|nr:hypothetical protein [Streptantibioticus silvisoli]MDI5969862.1 hypothetical protein [Streptantibioticus silvisoli]
MPFSDPPLNRPARLLTQNRRLRAIGVWNWTLPAWAGRFTDGRTYNTCPSAGVCRDVCYARHGTYRWPNVLARHQANLRFVLDDLPSWERAMNTELDLPKFRGRWVRVHDAGDFFSDTYLAAWLRIVRDHPETSFYAYTKEVRRFRALVEGKAPENFRWVYSFGGTQDAELDPDRDRVADVFPDEAAATAAGWHSQADSDLLSVLGPRQVAVPANRIPAALTRLGNRTFSEWQAEADEQRRARRRTGRPVSGETAAVVQLPTRYRADGGSASEQRAAA